MYFGHGFAATIPVKYRKIIKLILCMNIGLEVGVLLIEKNILLFNKIMLVVYFRYNV